LDRFKLAQNAREQRSDRIKTKVFQVAEVLLMQESLCKKSGNVNISRVAKIANCKRETAKKYLIEGGYININL
jgi:Fic family protein